MATRAARIIHTSISRPWTEVYRFAANPENMPQWASGLASGIRKDGDRWLVYGSPVGEVSVRFAKDNSYGVIDHTVTMPDGSEVFNALRVVPNADGAEVMFTLLKLPHMDDAAFEADARHVTKDLDALKRLIEDRP